MVLWHKKEGWIHHCSAIAEMRQEKNNGRLGSESNRTGPFQNPQRVYNPRGAPAPLTSPPLSIINEDDSVYFMIPTHSLRKKKATTYAGQAKIQIAAFWQFLTDLVQKSLAFC
jgi:hypothetical protein